MCSNADICRAKPSGSTPMMIGALFLLLVAGAVTFSLNAPIISCTVYTSAGFESCMRTAQGSPASFIYAALLFIPPGNLIQRTALMADGSEPAAFTNAFVNSLAYGIFSTGSVSEYIHW